MLVFTCIFCAFGVVVYRIAYTTLFRDIDAYYEKASEDIRNYDIDVTIDNFLNGRNIVYTENGSVIISYKTYLILRNSDGELLDGEHYIPYDYLLNIGFSPSDSEKFATERVDRNDQTIYFRTYTIPVTDSSGELYYIQMATAVTEIYNSLNAILRILVQGIALMLVVAFGVSWFLGKFLTDAVSDTWEKQDEFLSYASHMIRAPLTVIHNCLEMMLQNPSSTILDNSEYVLHSLSESSRLRNISNRLMTMASLETADFVPNSEWFELDKLIKNMASPFIFQAQESGKTFDVDLQDGLKIYGDNQLIREMCILIVENALKYTESGDSIMLSTKKTGNNASITIADTGIGISDEAVSSIFTRFYRAAGAKKTQGGSGLGLYIASLIVNRHNGDIAVSHNLPKGTVFVIRLPIDGK